MHVAPRKFISAGLLAVVALYAVPARAENQETQRLIQFNKGVVAFRNEQYEQAKRIFSELVRQQEDDLGARYWLGLCQLQLNDHAGAAESFQRVLEQEPERLEVQLDYAIALVGQGNYKRGRDLLREYVDSAPDDPVTLSIAYFFLGRCEYELGNHEAAHEAFDKAEAGQPNDTMRGNIAFYRGLTYLEQDQREQAAEELKRASAVSPDLSLQARARSLAEQAVTGTVEPEFTPLEISVSFGLSYDTNVILLGNGASTPVEYSGEDDFRFGLSSDIRYLHFVGEKWLLGIGGSTYNSWHASLQEFNVQTYAGRAFVNYFANDRITLGLQGEYDYTLVDNDAFLARGRVTPSVRLVEAFHDDDTTPLTASTVFYAFEKRNYHDELQTRQDDRDGDYQNVGVVQSFNFTQPRIEQGDSRWLSGSVGYQFLDQSTQGNDFDMSASVLSARLAVPLPQEVIFEFQGRWAWERYWQPNSEDWRRRKRKDFVQRYIWTLSRAFELDRNITMDLTGQIAYTVDDSNVRNRLGEAVYSYDRVIYGLSLTFNFR